MWLQLVLIAATSAAAHRSATSAQDNQAVLVDARPLPGNLQAIDADWNISLVATDDQKSRTVALEELVLWGRPSEPAAGDLVLWGKHSLLAGQVVALDAKQILMRSDVWGRVALDRHHVRGVAWQVPTDPVKRQQMLDAMRIPPDSSRWGERLGGANATSDSDDLSPEERPGRSISDQGADESPDSLQLVNGDVLRGQLIDFTRERIHFRIGGAEVTVDHDQVVYWVTSDRPPTVPPKESTAPRALVGLRDGSVLAAVQVELGNRLRLLAEDNLELRSDPIVDPLTERTVCFLQSLGGRIQYLSDLAPLGYKHLPYLTLEWPWRADRNVLGGRLRVRDVTYRKGLGVLSMSRLAYELREPFSRFEAELAVDQAAAGEGSVVFRLFVYADDVWYDAYTSPVVRGGQPPVSISIPLPAARGLALLVEFADRGDQRDYADWLNARLVRPTTH